jgi:hypothetical protein
MLRFLRGLFFELFRSRAVPKGSFPLLLPLRVFSFWESIVILQFSSLSPAFMTSLAFAQPRHHAVTYIIFFLQRISLFPGTLFRHRPKHKIGYFGSIDPIVCHKNEYALPTTGLSRGINCHVVCFSVIIPSQSYRILHTRPPSPTTSAQPLGYEFFLFFFIFGSCTY